MLEMANCADAAAHQPESKLTIAELYEELTVLARRLLKRERDDQQFEPTALVHEAFMLLERRRDSRWCERGQAKAAYARSMRRILLDHARARARQKRGGGRHRIDSIEPCAPSPENRCDLIALGAALERFAREDPIRAAVVELRYFEGLTEAEIARVMRFSVPTVQRYWVLARSWLRRELSQRE